MSKTITDKTLALAGLFQAVSLVAQTARRGMVEQAPFETVIRSLFVRNADATVDVYGDLSALRHGLQTVRRQLGGDSAARDLELTRYAVALLTLERKMAARKDLLATIAEGLEKAERQMTHFHATHDSVIAALADIYVNTVSTLQPRIMVTGEHGHLQNPDTANRVRALLLAGMRSAVLWSQSGGSRLQLLFRRKTFLNEAERLLAQMTH
ncbi:MAG: lysogenization regulator HflD [Gammaproteobacteria bacterium HGW-Gammaproteobacteria-1]|jgi:high frequency lysogenization protein|nr:MAG: lysogenization regulator HflD [Gammaproteobacteria bacterium HGW-Gammaproteobacteria-1]